MHAAIGTALGGVCTTVGEPQNLLIASYTGWEFMEFFWRMSPVTMPVLAAGLTTRLLLEKTKIFDYGAQLPEPVRDILVEFDQHEASIRTDRDKAGRAGCCRTVFSFCFAFHVAGWSHGLTIIVIQTAFNGIIEEHQLGHAFEEALPFTALLVVFFGVV